MNTTKQVNEVAEPPMVAQPSFIDWRKAGIYIGLALGFFLFGAVLMGVTAWDVSNQRDLARHELRLSKMQGMLASSVIDARRGEYEPARQTASDFFTELRSQIDRGTNSDLTQVQQDRLKPLLAQRDDLITLLARTDPAAADRLSDLYTNYRGVMSNAPASAKN